MKIYIFRDFLPLKEALVSTFNEKHEPTSRKYVAVQDKIMRNFLPSLQFFWPHFSVFALEKWPKNLDFHGFFTSK